MSDKLQFRAYNKDRLAVQGNRELYDKFIKSIGGRWNPRMRGGEGWLVHISERAKLEEYINEENRKSRNEGDKEEEIFLKSRKNQNKYHRERSREFELSDDDEITDPVITEALDTINRERELHRQEKRQIKAEIERLEREKAERRAQRKKESSDTGKDKSNNQLDHYHSFSKNQSDFHKLNDQADISYSSSPSYSKSSSHYPSPSTPKETKHEERGSIDSEDLQDKVRDLQRRLCEMEIQNRKLIAQQNRRKKD